MKKPLSNLLFLVMPLVFISTSARSQYRSDSCGCPIPLGDTGGTFQGRYLPPYRDLPGRLSPDGKWLSFDGELLLNLSTLERRHIVIPQGLPSEVPGGCTDIVWCPYDPDLLALHVWAFIDTIGNGVPVVEVENLFTYRVSTGHATRITPNILGKYGPPGESSYLMWLPSSSAGKDSFMIGYSAVDALNNQPFFGIYSPQTQALIPKDIAYSDTMWSPNWKHKLWYHPDTIYGTPNYGGASLPLYLDSIPLNFPEPLDTTTGIGLHGVTFSPDDKLVAYWVWPMGYGPPADSIFDQVWVCGISKPASPICVINFQCLYCMYSFWGVYPVFITDSTLAVSMHHDGDSVSPMWEITTCGKIVRQLTYVPKNLVTEPTKPALSVQAYPTPFAARTSIRITLQDAGFAKVTIFNVMGEEVAQIFSGKLGVGDHSFIWDGTTLPTGTYFCVLRTAGSQSIASIQHE